MPDPKNQFLEDKDWCKAHFAIVKSEAFERAVTYALADLACDSPTKEELNGANKFIYRLTHLADAEEERPNPFGAPRLIPPEQLVPEPK